MPKKERFISTDELPLTLPTAIARGLRCRCPNCGIGKMFQSFLKVQRACPVCGEELYHHRADDLPAYLIILIVGHILLPLVAIVEINYALSYWLDAAIWIPLALLMTLGLLQPVKGAIVAIQWYHGMHDFGAAKARRLARVPRPMDATPRDE